MSEDQDLLFVARTPLGFAVRVTKAYWEIISTLKHPVMRGHLDEVRAALESPDEIRLSKTDDQVYFFTRLSARGGGCVQ